MSSVKLSKEASIHESQDQTAKLKYSAELGDKEINHGLTCAVLSRAKKFGGFR